ncbi:hypothetical protein TB2_021578 [Malus domestica]
MPRASLVPSSIPLPYQHLAKIPHVVIGTGGYVSFSLGLAAKLIGAKPVIQEQNGVPGIAKWVLSIFADVMFVAYNYTIDCFPSGRTKCVVCGNSVRLSLKKQLPKAAAIGRFFPKAGGVGEIEKNEYWGYITNGSEEASEKLSICHSPYSDPFLSNGSA